MHDMSARPKYLWLIWFTVLAAVCFPQIRQAPRPRRQGPPPRAPGPAYLQRLKALEETQYVTKAVLKNGLTFMVYEFHALPVATVSTYVKTGYVDETDETAGLSEVVARMFFRGTTTRPSGTMGRDVKALGGALESVASYDHMTHDLVVPAAQWKKALEIQADAFVNSVMDPADLKRAVELTLAGAKRQSEDPAASSQQKLLEIGLGQSGPGRGPIGSEQTLRNLTSEKALEYLKAHYTASRTTIVVAGDVLTSEVLAEGVKLYDTARPDPAKVEHQVQPAAPQGFHYLEQRGPTRLPRILFGFPVAPESAADAAGLEVLHTILGLGQASRIPARWRDQKKVIINGSTALETYGKTGYLLISFEVEPKDIDRAEIGILTELELIKREEPDDEDMARALAQLEREYWLNLQTVSGRAHTLERFEAQGDWKKMNQYLSRLKQVKAADVKRLAEEYLSLEHCSLVEYLPGESEARNLSAEAAFKTFQELLPSAVEQEIGEREKETVPAVKVPEASGAFKPSEVRFPFQQASILRGPTLVIREDHTLPLIQMGFFFPGGRLLEKKGNEGVTALMLGTMLRGTREKGVREINRQMDLYGAEMIPVVDRDYFGVRLSVLSQNIEPALELLAEMIQSPGFSDEELAHQKAMQSALIREEELCAARHASELLDGGLFKDSPYALAPYGNVATLASITPPMVKEWYNSTVHNKKPVVVIIGDTQGTSLAEFFVRRFSGSRFQDTKLPEEFAKPLTSRALVEANLGTGASRLILGFQAPPIGDEDSYALAVLGELLAGEGGRLVEQLVYSQGLAYDVSFRYGAYVRGGSVQIGVTASSADEDKCAKALESELKKLLDGPITYREYRSAVNATIGAYGISQQDKMHQINQTARDLISGATLESAQDVVTRVQDVKEEDLPDVARRILNLNNSVTVRLHGVR